MSVSVLREDETQYTYKGEGNSYLKTLRSLPRLSDIPYKFTAATFFCGGGGLDLGLAFAGFDVKFASDIEEPHCKTISENFPDCVTLPIDISLLTGDKIREMTGVNEFDLVAGGPPCQAFSILGNRNSFSDPRGRLVYEYARIITELQPRAFLFENVPGLLTLNKGKDWAELLKYYEEETKYKLYYKVLNSANYGVPQTRQRVIVVGFKDQSALFDFPKHTHRDPKSLPTLWTRSLPDWLPSRYALEDVEGLPNHRIRPHSDRVRDRYSLIPPGGRDKVDHTDRLHPDKPAGTVLVGSRAGGGRPHIHPAVPRHITVREAARLQSFPDWYVLHTTETWQYRAVGNAVPPLMAKAVGDQIATTLSEPGGENLLT